MSKEKRRVPKLRFPGFTEDWEQRKLNEFLIVSNIQNTENKYDKNDVLSVSGEYGIINQINFQGRSFAGTSVFNYGVVEIGDIVYTKSPLKLNPYGVIKTNRFNTGIVSTLYAIYKTKENCDSKFIEHYFNLDDRLNKYLKPLVNKGAKNTLMVSSENALIGEVSFPQITEQKLIADFLDCLDKYITLHQRKLDNLKLKKKALLQKLFPKNGERYPELRFPGFTDAWEQRKFKDIAFKRGKISEVNLPYVEFEDINSGIGTLNKNILQKVGYKKGILFEAGDVLFGKLRPYLQNWLLCQFMGIAVGDFWVFQPQIVSSAFLYFLIQSEAYQSVANISSGTKMPRSSWALVSETRFSIPKYKEATRIGEFLTSIDKNITLHQRKLDHLQLQKKALLQQMFV